MTLAERFSSKWMPEPNSGCWLWTGAMAGDRPSIYFPHRGLRNTQGARASWHLYRGDIPDSLYVCHHCDVRSCVNPDHLFLGTQEENLADMAAKGRGRGPLQDRENAKLVTKLCVADIVKIRSSRLLQRETAALFGITQANVSEIIRRRTWKHVA